MGLLHFVQTKQQAMKTGETDSHSSSVSKGNSDKNQKSIGNFFDGCIEASESGLGCVDPEVNKDHQAVLKTISQEAEKMATDAAGFGQVAQQEVERFSSRLPKPEDLAQQQVERLSSFLPKPEEMSSFFEVLSEENTNLERTMSKIKAVKAKETTEESRDDPAANDATNETKEDRNQQEDPTPNLQDVNSVFNEFWMQNIVCSLLSSIVDDTSEETMAKDVQTPETTEQKEEKEEVVKDGNAEPFSDHGNETKNRSPQRKMMATRVFEPSRTWADSMTQNHIIKEESSPLPSSHQDDIKMTEPPRQHDEQEAPQLADGEMMSPETENLSKGSMASPDTEITLDESQTKTTAEPTCRGSQGTTDGSSMFDLLDDDVFMETKFFPRQQEILTKMSKEHVPTQNDAAKDFTTSPPANEPAEPTPTQGSVVKNPVSDDETNKEQSERYNDSVGIEVPHDGCIEPAAAVDTGLSQKEAKPPAPSNKSVKQKKTQKKKVKARAVTSRVLKKESATVKKTKRGTETTTATAEQEPRRFKLRPSPFWIGISMPLRPKVAGKETSKKNIESSPTYPDSSSDAGSDGTKGKASSQSPIHSMEEASDPLRSKAVYLESKDEQDEQGLYVPYAVKKMASF
mmetsp:Transcript_11532/g.20710  ORF Transcript_11532/g.20710 Transcript_11532/m.20710 type:complete len:628 (-) Transcript_11532:199-2082(-)